MKDVIRIQRQEVGKNNAHLVGADMDGKCGQPKAEDIGKYDRKYVEYGLRQLIED